MIAAKNQINLELEQTSFAEITQSLEVTKEKVNFQSVGNILVSISILQVNLAWFENSKQKKITFSEDILCSSEFGQM